MKFTGLIAAAMLAPLAMADIQFTMNESGDGSEASESTISIRNGKVVMESTDEGGFTIYDSATGELTQVDHGEKMYMVMDEETMDQAANQMSEMMKQMEAQLAHLPADQREAMMKMLPGMAGGMDGDKKPASASVEWTGKKDKVAGYKCRVASIVEPDGDRSSACIASPGELGMSKEDFQAVASMFETMRSISERFQNEAPMPSLGDLDGLPIKMDDADGSTIALTSVDNSSLDGELFEVPAGYKRREMMDMGR